MHIQNNEGGWDVLDDDQGGYFNPNDYSNLTTLYIDCVAAIMAFKSVIENIETTELLKSEQIEIYNLIKRSN